MLENFPQKLKYLRKQCGLTQEQLASHIGANESYISQLENGNRLPGTKIVFKIADFFGVSVDVLVRDELDLDVSNDSS